MESPRLRLGLITALAAGVGLLSIYRIFIPARLSTEAIILTVLLTALVVGETALLRWIRPEQKVAADKKRYLITLPATIVTTLVAGVATAPVLYGAATVLERLQLFAQYEPLSLQLLDAVIRRLSGVLAAAPSTLVGAAVLLSLMLGTGFWLFYPYLPVDRTVRAAPAAFVLTWLYLLLFLLILGVPALPGVRYLVIDAAAVALWGKFFAILYNLVHHAMP